MLLSTTKSYRSGIHQFLTYGFGSSNSTVQQLNQYNPIEVMRLTGSNIGIGTTIAKKTLDVSGDINFSGGLFQNNQPYISSQWTNNTSSNTLYYLSNVGIGTTIAKQKLDVQGSVNFSGNLYQNGTVFMPSQYYNWTAPPITGRSNLSAHNITSNYKVNDDITDWNGVQALSSGTSLQPLYMRDENFLPYISFNGKNNTNGSYLSFGSQTFNLLTNNGLTFGVYIRFTSGYNYERVLDFSNGAGVNNILVARDTTTQNLLFQSYPPTGTILAQTAYNAIINNVWQIMFFRFQLISANTWTLSTWINGTQFITNTFTNSSYTNNYTLANCYVGRSPFTNDNYASFDLREFSLFDRALSDSEIVTMTNYYTNKYNITIPIAPLINIDNNIITKGQIGIGTNAPTSDLQIYNNPTSSFNISQNTYKLINRIQSPNVNSGNTFGTSCFISGNGLYLFASAPNYDGAVTDGGAGYIYYWNKGRWEYMYGFQVADVATNDALGRGGIASSFDGTTFVISSISKNTNTGKVYIYNLSSTSTFTLRTSLVGTSTNDYFGSGLAMSGDGYTLVVGAYGRTNTVSMQGVAYVYSLVPNTSGWTLATTLVSATPTIGSTAAFGYANAISTDGTVIVCGAYLDSTAITNLGSISVFRKIGGTWTARAYTYEPNNRTTANFGSAVGCSGDGSKIIVAANNFNGATGRVYIYSYRRGTTDTLSLVQQLSPSDLAANSYFSRNVNISNDGNTVVISAYGLGKTYIYRCNTAGSYYIYQTMTNDISGLSGYALSTNGDATVCVITSPTATVSGLTNVGAMVVYQINYDVFLTNGRMLVNSHIDLLGEQDLRFVVRTTTPKSSTIKTYTDCFRIESQDSLPCCFNIGLLANSTSTNQGYYINIVEPSISDNRPLSIQPFTDNSGGFVGIGTTTPLTKLHVNGLIRSIVPVMARRLSAAQAVPNTSDTVIKFDLADNFDTNSTLNGLTYANGTGLFTNTSGITQIYQVSYQVAYSANSAGNRVTWIWINSSAQGRYAMMNLPSSSDFPVLSSSATIVLSNNDAMGVYTWQNSGAGLNIGGAYAGMSSGYSTRIQITMM